MLKWGRHWRDTSNIICYFRSLPLLSVLFHAFINHICLFLVCFPFVCMVSWLGDGGCQTSWAWARTVGIGRGRCRIAPGGRILSIFLVIFGYFRLFWRNYVDV